MSTSDEFFNVTDSISTSHGERRLIPSTDYRGEDLRLIQWNAEALEAIFTRAAWAARSSTFLRAVITSAAHGTGATRRSGRGWRAFESRHGSGSPPLLHEDVAALVSTLYVLEASTRTKPRNHADNEASPLLSFLTP